jgi:hypothetical protein
MDPNGHTTLAEWSAEDAAGQAAAQEALTAQLRVRYYAVVSRADGTAEQVSELPQDEALVLLRRPIAGG